jgi:hypothetical protein
VRDRAASASRRLRQGLDQSLFPPSPAPQARVRWWEGTLVVVSFLALAIALQLFRIGPTEATTTVWAEDGPFFLSSALSHGFFDSLGQTYAGYLVVVQRLIGELGALVPLPDASTAIALGACFVIALSGLAVWFASAGHIWNPYLRGLLVALTVLCPVASLEAVVSGTYVAWYMAFAAFWLLLWRPRSDWAAVLGGLFILITALSGPVIFFLVPLALLRALAIRDRRDAILVGSFALGLAIQVPATLLSDEGTVTPAWTSDILTAYLQRVVDGSVLGEELGGSIWKEAGWQFLIPFVLAIVAFTAALVARTSSGRLLAVIAIATSIGMFLLSAYQRAVGAAMVWPEAYYHGLGGRYAIVPALLLVSAILVLVDAQTRSNKGNLAVFLAAGAAGVLLLGLVTSFSLGDRNQGSPAWEDSLRQAAATCRAENPTQVSVYTAPAGVTAPLPCDEVVSAVESSPAR